VASAQGATFTLEEERAGAAPAAWTVVSGEWKVQSLPGGGQAVAQTSSVHSGSYFNVLLAPAKPVRNVGLRVRVRALAGQEDQGGGLVWRWQDPKNYYVMRINPLEDNYRLYRVVDGRRVQLASHDVELDSGRWYSLRLTMRGADMEALLDDRKCLEVQDSTFTQAGKVGLWTKADAVTQFDDLGVEALSD